MLAFTWLAEEVAEVDLVARQHLDLRAETCLESECPLSALTASTVNY